MGWIRGDLPERTLKFAENILKLSDDLPNNVKGWVLGKQFIRSGTGIGASVQEADHALTDSDFAYKCSVSRKEASETLYWLQLCERAGLLSGELLQEAQKEASELVSILSTIVRKTHHHLQKS